MRNQDIIGESDSVNLKVCLSIANEIRLKTYFANGGQKELFSPLLQSPDTTKQSTDDPIFRDYDEDTLVRLLSTGYDMHRRCFEFCLEYLLEDKVNANILRNPSVGYSKALVMERLYSRLQKSSKALECLKSIPKDSPEYARCAAAQGFHHKEKGEWEKATECFETALEYSQDLIRNIIYHRDLALILFDCYQFKKARSKMEEAIKLHDKIFGKDSETWLLRDMLLLVGNIFLTVDDTSTAIQMFQKVEQMQKRATRCDDIDVLHLNLCMALSYCNLGQNDRSLKYLERMLYLSHKIFGEDNLSSELVRLYKRAANVYGRCGRYDEALSLLERSLKWMESLYSDTVHPSKIVEIEENWQ